MEVNNTLIDILSEAMFSTVEANNRATEEFFQKLAEIGVSSDSSLETVECVVKGKDNMDYVLRIPKLILMPMPLLHVKEATFDVEGEWEIRESETSVEEIERTISSTARPKELSISSVSVRKLSDLVEKERTSILSVSSFRDDIMRASIPPQDKRVILNEIKPSIVLASNHVSSTTTSSSSDEKESSKNQNLKIKVSVKMEQSDMPAGLSNLIQTITNCIEVKKEE
ncbi:MAG: DUF2589 domain-containing protein [Paludibacteraceae bacterium]|nr:DUF2589 domain-containing protein [Paludibacteraceae bacterium]